MPRAKERELHLKFSSIRLHGEWFKPTTELLEYIKKNGSPYKASDYEEGGRNPFSVRLHPDLGRRLREYCAEYGLTMADVFEAALQQYLDARDNKRTKILEALTETST